ncbi:hypothetical protein BKA64DRAFT_445739 [Cadophora sp. MPI-SDFR-AT-0126]|nr:hypothetical protein BKA64DRAFT_445739 [Leotiomycetes sp. MPI-SDFR-AT-0126]
MDSRWRKLLGRCCEVLTRRSGLLILTFCAVSRGVSASADFPVPKLPRNSPSQPKSKNMQEVVRIPRSSAVLSSSISHLRSNRVLTLTLIEMHTVVCSDLMFSCDFLRGLLR